MESLIIEIVGIDRIPIGLWLVGVHKVHHTNSCNETPKPKSAVISRDVLIYLQSASYRRCPTPSSILSPLNTRLFTFIETSQRQFRIL